MQSGAPFTVTTNTNNTNAFSAGNQRANVLRDPVLPAEQHCVNDWFDITAFAQPAIYTFGNGGRDNMCARGRGKRRPLAQPQLPSLGVNDGAIPRGSFSMR